MWSCLAVWKGHPRSPAPPRPPPTRRFMPAAWLGLPPLPLASPTLSVNTFHATLTTTMQHHLDVDSSVVPVPTRHHRVNTLCRHQKLKFDRVEMSQKMKEIVDQLKPLCAKVSAILNIELLDSSRSIVQCIGTSLDTWFSKGQWPTPSNRNAMMSRPITTPEFIEPKLYGREDEKTDIIFDITKGKYCEKNLTVLPIVGPGA